MVVSLRAPGLFAAMTLLCGPAMGQLAPNAPQDKPYALTQQQILDHDKLVAPYIEEARRTYPPARARFLAGLPPGETFFVVARLFDSKGHREDVFIRVKSIKDGRVTGVISSQIMIVSGFKLGQKYSFSEPDLIDWLISRPDGSEEGNVVGKFMDTQTQ